MLYKYYFCNQRNIVIVLDLIKQTAVTRSKLTVRLLDSWGNFNTRDIRVFSA